MSRPSIQKLNNADLLHPNKADDNIFSFISVATPTIVILFLMVVGGLTIMKKLVNSMTCNTYHTFRSLQPWNQSNSQPHSLCRLYCNQEHLATSFPLQINNVESNNHLYGDEKRLWSIGLVNLVVLTDSTNNLGSFDYHNWHPNIRATCHVTSDIISL